MNVNFNLTPGWAITKYPGFRDSSLHPVRQLPLNQVGVAEIQFEQAAEVGEGLKIFTEEDEAVVALLAVSQPRFELEVDVAAFELDVEITGMADFPLRQIANQQQGTLHRNVEQLSGVGPIAAPDLGLALEWDPVKFSFLFHFVCGHPPVVIVAPDKTQYGRERSFCQ